MYHLTSKFCFIWFIWIMEISVYVLKEMYRKIDKLIRSQNETMYPLHFELVQVFFLLWLHFDWHIMIVIQTFLFTKFNTAILVLNIKTLKLDTQEITRPIRWRQFHWYGRIYGKPNANAIRTDVSVLQSFWNYK